MKCDELKFERLGDANETYPASTLVIRKQFVDAAIDELKREHHKERDEYIDWVNRLQKEYAELKEVYKESVDVKVKIWERCKKAEDEIRHHKYKRCLAMAKLCHWKMGVFIYKKEKNDFYHRWHKRWLELAEKFKEAK